MSATNQLANELGEVVAAPKKGERWDCGRTNRTARVMSDPVEGYVMWRFKGAGPNLTHVNDWHKRFIRKDTARQAAGEVAG